MPKPLALSIAVCLGLTGCQVFQKSQTWDLVTKVRPGEAAKDPDPSNAYAAKLHRTLAENGVEHKVVTYQYRYLTHMREEAVRTRTAVVYRDATNSKYPWWLKDDLLNPPVWLPNGDLNEQISFYVRRKAEVLDQKAFPAGGASNKMVLATARPAAGPQRSLITEHRTATTRITPVKEAPKPAPRLAEVKAPAVKPVPAKKPVAKQSIAKAPTSKRPPTKQPAARHFFAVEPTVKPGSANEPVSKITVSKAPGVKPVPAHKPAAKKTIARTPVVKKPVSKEPAPAPLIAKTPVIPPVEVKESVAKTPAAIEPVAPEKTLAKIRFRTDALNADSTPASEPLPPPIASHSPTPWKAPTELSPGQRSKGITYVDEPSQKLFREKTGTQYNPASPADRRKMDQLKRTAAAHE